MLLGLLGQRLQELGVDLRYVNKSESGQLSDRGEADLVGDPELVREAGGVFAHLCGRHAPNLPTWGAQGVAFELNQLNEDSYCQLF